MTACLDDWTLSGLSGAMDWTVVLSPGASNATAGASPSPHCIFAQSHFYSALYTELTPTVLTGSESASSVGAVLPIVYARLSSIVSVEKVGPRQLRLRQQLGCPGLYRLLFLTAPSEVACDDWWHALRRLAYSNNHSAITMLNSGLGANAPHQLSNSVNNDERWRQQQPQQQPRTIVVQSETAPWTRANAASSAAPSQPPARPVDKDVDVAQLKRVLPPSTPHAGFLVGGGPSTHPSPSPSLDSPQRTNSKPLRQTGTEATVSSSENLFSNTLDPTPPPLSLSIPGKGVTSPLLPVTPPSLNASTINTTTATLTSSHEGREATAVTVVDSNIAATNATAGAAVTGERHRYYRQLHPREKSHASSAMFLPSSSAAAAAADVTAAAPRRPSPSSFSPPSAVVLRVPRNEATQTSTADFPASRPMKAVVAPSFSSLLQDEGGNGAGVCQDAAAVTPVMTVSSEVTGTSTTAAAAAVMTPLRLAGRRRSTRMLSPLKESPSSTQPLSPSTDNEQQQQGPRLPPPASGKIPSADKATAPLQRWQQQPEPTKLQLDINESSASPPPAQTPSSLPLPAWKTVRVLRPITSTVSTTLTKTPTPPTAAVIPPLYEPVHVDSFAVPRARSTSPPAPCLSAPLSSFMSTFSAVRLLSWRSEGTTSALTPRLTYGSPFPYRRSRSVARLALLQHQKSTTLSSRRRHASSFSAPPPLQREHRLHRICSANTSTAKPRSRTCSEKRSLPAPPSDGASALTVSPLLSVIARPHLFLKYPVQVPSASRSATNSTSGAPKSTSAERGGSGVATYVFVTTDEDCVVAVPASRFRECVEDTKLPQEHGGARPHHHNKPHSPSPFATRSVSICVRSYERAKCFFGEEYCLVIRVADVDRVTRGNEEPLVLLNTLQRERFRDLSKLICIVAHTHAFFLEAASSTEAEWYVRSWKKYIRTRDGLHKKPHRRGY